MKLNLKFFVFSLVMMVTFNAFAAGNTSAGKIRETNQNALNLDEGNDVNTEEEALLKEEIPTQKNEESTDAGSEEAKNSEELSDEEIALANSYPEGLESTDVNF